MFGEDRHVQPQQHLMSISLEPLASAQTPLRTLGSPRSTPNVVESVYRPPVVSLVSLGGASSKKELVLFRHPLEINLREGRLLVRKWDESGHWMAIESISDVLILSSLPCGGYGF